MFGITRLSALVMSLLYRGVIQFACVMRLTNQAVRIALALRPIIRI